MFFLINCIKAWRYGYIMLAYRIGSKSVHPFVLQSTTHTTDRYHSQINSTSIVWYNIHSSYRSKCPRAYVALPNECAKRNVARTKQMCTITVKRTTPMCKDHCGKDQPNIKGALCQGRNKFARITVARTKQMFKITVARTTQMCKEYCGKD